MAVNVAGAELFLTLYLPMIYATACVIWLGYAWGAIPAYISTFLVALSGGVPVHWGLLFSFANPLGLAVYAIAYRSIPIRTDLRSLAGFLFFVLTAFVAALVGSSGSFVWGYTNQVEATDLYPIWQGWWLGGFLQTMVFNVPLFLFLSPRIGAWKRRQKLGHGAMAPSRARLGAAFGMVVGTLAGYVLLVRQFSLAELEGPLETLSKLDPELHHSVLSAFSGLTLVHWVTLALVVSTGVFGYQVMMHWTSRLSQSRDALSGVNARLVTENRARRQAEDELAEQALLLKEANASKDRFFSIISHDLRSPLAALRTITSALTSDIKSFDRDTIEEFVRHIDTAGANLADLLDNLLSWARLQTHAMKHEPERVNLTAMARQIETLLRPAATEKQVHLHIRVEEDTWVWADPNMLRSILLNLLSNGLKFTHAGGAVVLTATEVDAGIRVEISDTGVGMDEKELGLLFRLDKVFSNPGTAQESGSGLGLILCHEMVAMHGGTLEVASSRGVGTAFSFNLPINPSGLEAPESSAAGEAGRPAHRRSRSLVDRRRALKS